MITPPHWGHHYPPLSPPPPPHKLPKSEGREMGMRAAPPPSVPEYGALGAEIRLNTTKGLGTESPLAGAFASVGALGRIR